jgi:hypothetical protein
VRSCNDTILTATVTSMFRSGKGQWLEAEREVDAQHRDARRNPGLHMLRAPNDGRPFLLSNRPSDELRKRYNLWAWFYLAVFTAVSTWGLVSLFGRSQ